MCVCVCVCVSLSLSLSGVDVTNDNGVPAAYWCTEYRKIVKFRNTLLMTITVQRWKSLFYNVEMHLQNAGRTANSEDPAP